jgi:two-component system, NtrC family, response regulator HydG
MRARLTVEAGPAEPRVLDLSPDVIVTLGRNATNALLLHDEKASRFHAEVFFADGGWHVRNCSTVNATRLDGERVREATRLRGGQAIDIGPVRLRFEDAPFEEIAVARPPCEPRLVAVPSAASGCTTRLDPDELTALFYFMNASYAETTPHGLVTLALRTVREQTRATVCGFLSFDTEDPQLKVVEPVSAEVNVQLSLHLTLKVRAQGCSAWLNARKGDDDDVKSASLAAYEDAICVPLRRNPAAEPAAGPRTEPLGALHAYHSIRRFSEREIRFCEVLAGCLANALHVLRARRALEADNSRLREHAGRGGDELVGDSPVIRQLRGDVACLAVSPCTVLIEGESGVGKELVALALHRLSLRHEGPLVTFNCAALSTSMADAELFGHEKGAFTGADRARQGLFQQADEGTLFLDEIGDLSPDSQARLLRVLDAKRVRPLLAGAEIPVDVRVISATNRDLGKEVQAGRFRLDLYYRLGARVRVPALRDHAEDIPALAAHFLAKLNVEYRRNVQLAPETIKRLQDYSWPGNVRQLRSVLETAMTMSPTDRLLRPAALRLGADGDDPAAAPATFNLKVLEARTIAAALKRVNGVVVKAARLLGIHRETLLKKIEKYGLRQQPDVADEKAR